MSSIYLIGKLSMMRDLKPLNFEWLVPWRLHCELQFFELQVVGFLWIHLSYVLLPLLFSRAPSAPKPDPVPVEQVRSLFKPRGNIVVAKCHIPAWNPPLYHGLVFEELFQCNMVLPSKFGTSRCFWCEKPDLEWISYIWDYLFLCGCLTMLSKNAILAITSFMSG